MCIIDERYSKPEDVAVAVQIFVAIKVVLSAV